MERTSSDGRLGLGINLVEELVSRDTAVTRERVHHPAIGRYRERATEEHRADGDDL